MTDYRNYLSRTLSRKEIDFLVQELADKPHRIDELLSLVKDNDRQIAWHTAWVLEKFFQQYPEFLSRRSCDFLTDITLTTGNESLRRLTFNIVARTDSSEELSVPLINACFSWIVSANTSIAVKAESIRYLQKVCQREPELLSELKLCVQQLMETTDTSAIRSVAKKVLC
jgi:hypothetical protein